MIRYPGILILLLALLGQVNAQETGFGIEKMADEESRQKALIYHFTESKEYNETDFIYQRMEWEVDPSIRFISGKVTSYFKILAESVDTIFLDLHQNLQVDSIVRKNLKIPFIHTNHKIRIPFEGNTGQIDSMSVFYHGVPTSSGFGSFETNVHGSRQTPVLWTLSEPYGALEWWPCKQSLADKIDSIDIIVITPKQYRTASNGILVSDQVSGNKRTMHWKHRHPIATYLVAIAATNYATYSDTLQLTDNRVIDILNYVYPENLETAKQQTPVTADLIQFYNGLLGEYPFADEKYGHAQFGWGGGMEHQTMSFVGNFSFGLIAHELAHQWFGDFITLASWQEIWLNEGFASYMAALAIENLRPADWFAWKKSNVESITRLTDGSVFVADTSEVNRIFDSRLSYHKASYLLHMLRWVLGDDHFFAGLRNYYNDPEIANGFVNTSQFQRHMEEAGDTSLQEFFNDWYFGEGYPVYSLTYWQPSDQELTIQLSQTTTHNSVDFFKMPVPVRLYNSDRSDSLDVRLDHQQNNQYFNLNPGFKVSEIQIDPDYWLISKTDQVVSVPINSAGQNIIAFPNPASDMLFIQVPQEIKIKSLGIYTIEGKQLTSFSTRAKQIDVSGLSAGVYVLKIHTNKGTVRQKFIKN